MKVQVKGLRFRDGVYSDLWLRWSQPLNYTTLTNTSAGIKFCRTCLYLNAEDAEYRQVHFTWPG